MLLASLYNAKVLPYILYATLFWKLLTKTDQPKITSLFFRFAKYLLRVAPWYSNLQIVVKLKVANPEISVAIRTEKHNCKVELRRNEMRGGSTEAVIMTGFQIYKYLFN